MTFSIAARDPDTGMFGVAVSTKLLCVGHLAPFMAAGAGAIATQSFVNPYIGIKGVQYLVEGMTAQDVLDRIEREDGRVQQPSKEHPDGQFNLELLAPYLLK